jgi:hypothetical protein
MVTDKTSAPFVVKSSNVYKFYSVSQDYVGNIEDAPGTPDQILSSSLPVTFVDFVAYKLSKTAILRWVTASEQNNHGFEIQRSPDGINFLPIGWVNGAGNSSSPITYFYTDTVPLNGKNFYRLKQVDLENHFKLSQIRQLDFSQSLEFNIYPNPVQNVLTIQFTDDRSKEIRITDILGRTVWMQKNVQGLSMTISLPTMSKGLYAVQVIDIDGKQHIQKLIKE